MTLIWILAATILVSAISLIGIFTFALRKELSDKILILIIGFAAGAMIGSAFLHLLPEAMETYPASHVFSYTLLGFCVFFLMERYFHWRHCHESVCDIHAFTYLNLVGDGIHNFTDGLIIAASFVTDFRLGVVTTLAVILHEVPQEMGDFGILVYGGFSKGRALLFNFMCALCAILGAVMGYALSFLTESASPFLISFTAGGFIYVAASDLIPELHKQKDAKRANTAFVTFVLGIAFMALAKFIL